MTVNDDMGSVSRNVDCCPNVCLEKMKRTATVRLDWM